MFRDEFEKAMVLIAMTQTSLLSVIAAAADHEKTAEVTDQLTTDLSRETPTVAKFLVARRR